MTVEEEFVVFYYDVRSGNAMPFHKKYLAFKQWWNSIKIQTLRIVRFVTHWQISTSLVGSFLELNVDVKDGRASGGGGDGDVMGNTRQTFKVQRPDPFCCGVVVNVNLEVLLSTCAVPAIPVAHDGFGNVITAGAPAAPLRHQRAQMRSPRRRKCTRNDHHVPPTPWLLGI